MTFGQRFAQALNYILPTAAGRPFGSNGPTNYNLPYTDRNAKDARSYLMPLQLERTTQDLGKWRKAITEAENAWYPTRYWMQIMFADIILEGHTYACIDRRNKLTSLKQFTIGPKGEVDEELTEALCDTKWFEELVEYILDAQYFGYSLIQFGDLVFIDGKLKFPRLTIIKRTHVEPDRQNMVAIPLQRTGVDFLDPRFLDENGQSWYDWLLYVDTKTRIGQSICGYGLLYQVAYYSIFLKNNLSQNADYNEKFGTPYREAKAERTLSNEEKDTLETALVNMGASGWIITPAGVEMRFHSEGGKGSGTSTYESFETRLQKSITKIILGHPNAMDETPGKLGGAQGGDEEHLSEAGKAMLQVEKDQDKFVLSVLNDEFIPKLRRLGVKIPQGYSFALPNDKEKHEARVKADKANLVTAQVFKTAKEAGVKLSAKTFTEITGLEAEDIEDEPQEKPMDQARELAMARKISNLLKDPTNG